MKLSVCLFAVLVLCMINTQPVFSSDYYISYNMDTFIDKIDISGPSSSFSAGKFNSGSYRTGRNKTLTLSAPIGYGMQVAFRYIDLREDRQDTLVLFDWNQPNTIRSTYTNKRSKRYKQKFPKEDTTFYAPSGQLGVTFTTGPKFSTLGFDGFEFIFTVEGNCFSSITYRCDNSRCISNGYKCDGHNNCGDRSDEKNCGNAGRNVGIGFGVVFLAIAIVCGIYIVIRRSRVTRTEVRTVHPPPGPGSYYPPPPPPYSVNQGQYNPGYH